MKEDIFRNLGASNHSLGKRQSEDFYATDPKAAELLLDVVPELNNIQGYMKQRKNMRNLVLQVCYLKKDKIVQKNLSLIVNILTITKVCI